MTDQPIPESYWVEENRFLAGEYPGGHNPEITRRRMDSFLKAGINTFLDLTQPHELVPYETILNEQASIHGMNTFYHRFSIHDHSIPSHETMIAILNTMDDALNAGHGVYVHCWGGVGRTGVVVGCYLVRHGHKNEQALNLVTQLYKTRPYNSHFPMSPETKEQIQFVLNWREVPESTHKSRQNFCEG